MSGIETFFDLDEGPPRDRYGRPLLIPRGGTEADRRWYTRASSLADKIDDFSHLHTWEKRYLARGMALRPDLCRLAAAEPYTTGFDKGNERENRASGKRLDEIIERALEAVKIHEKADYGTAVHARTEPGNDGTDWDERQAQEVESFWAKVKELGIAIIGTEVFTATDATWSAGTFDHLMYVPGIGIIITDKKTSREPDGKYDVQLAGYANGDIYDYTTDQRQTLEEYVAERGWDPGLVRRDIGILFWIKNGKTSLHPLDLKAGWTAAQVAAWVRDEHHTKRPPVAFDKEVAASADGLRIGLHSAISTAQSLEDLNALWNHPANQAIWSDEHTAAAVKRKGDLA